MKIEKTKYNINLTEEDKNAILGVMELANTLYDENICDNKQCEKCPLRSSFCISKGIDDEGRIKIFLDRLEKFINEE